MVVCEGEKEREKITVSKTAKFIFFSQILEYARPITGSDGKESACNAFSILVFNPWVESSQPLEEARENHSSILT